MLDYSKLEDDLIIGITHSCFQEDGTWTDIPRCIEHDPGVDEQIPGTCPSIPGYCAQGFLNTRCRFDCVNGPVSYESLGILQNTENWPSIVFLS